MKTSDFDYSLPQGYIAQTPIEPRDHSRLLVLNRRDGSICHRHFYEIGEYLRPGDVLVFNDSRVIPARLVGRKTMTGGRVEVLLLRRREPDIWEALVSRRGLAAGSRIEVLNPSGESLHIEVIEPGLDGTRIVRLSDDSRLAGFGQVPLPPYIHAVLNDPERYQTVYSRDPGSAAAPTAGLHFTPELLHALKEAGVDPLFITLHIGLDTFRPVKEVDPQEHVIHREYAVVSPEVAGKLSVAKREGRRIIAVGTTVVRVLEQVAPPGSEGEVRAFQDWVSLFILPGHRFRLVDALVTNFHLPRSTLLMLVSAFAGKDLIFQAYDEAIRSGYRFYSFGDAMLVI